jgi:hypothetical protein
VPFNSPSLLGFSLGLLGFSFLTHLPCFKHGGHEPDEQAVLLHQTAGTGEALNLLADARHMDHMSDLLFDHWILNLVLVEQNASPNPYD